jgi:hypothetical protein
MLNTLKPYLGGMKITFDRANELVVIEQKGMKTVLTYEQAICEVEKLFDDEI